MPQTVKKKQPRATSAKGADVLALSGVASIALANRSTQVTRNIRDFQLAAGLRFENWVD